MRKELERNKMREKGRERKKGIKGDKKERKLRTEGYLIG